MFKEVQKNSFCNEWTEGFYTEYETPINSIKSIKRVIMEDSYWISLKKYNNEIICNLFHKLNGINKLIRRISFIYSEMETEPVECPNCSKDIPIPKIFCEPFPKFVCPHCNSEVQMLDRLVLIK